MRNINWRIGKLSVYHLRITLYSPKRYNYRTEHNALCILWAGKEILHIRTSGYQTYIGKATQPNEHN